ncbi:MAG: M23 family metallopeptidase [Actinobacteria bacterium]|nr:MAG: M23 family metallopeptidase [Actinomycetota bacterium]
MRRLVLCALCALVCASAAQAMTDGGPGLAFQWPAQGTVTSPYGNDAGRWHPGVDIGILESLDVVAAAPGIVVAVGEPAGFLGYGEIVQVDVGAGLTTLYAHLSQPRVEVGDRVWTGELLGIAGCTGICTGTHLHFELRQDGVAIDPTPLLPR